MNVLQEILLALQVVLLHGRTVVAGTSPNYRQYCKTMISGTNQTIAGQLDAAPFHICFIHFHWGKVFFTCFRKNVLHNHVIQ